MRVSSVGWLFNTEDEVLSIAKKSAEATHNHPEGIKGAQAVALAIYLARIGKNKIEIKKNIEDKFGYNLSDSVNECRTKYGFDATCQGSVPQAIISFLESNDFTSAIQNAISLRADSDTQACIAGAIAEAYYKVIPQKFIDLMNDRISNEMKTLLEKFSSQIKLLQ